MSGVEKRPTVPKENRKYLVVSFDEKMEDGQEIKTFDIIEQKSLCLKEINHQNKTVKAKYGDDWYVGSIAAAVQKMATAKEYGKNLRRTGRCAESSCDDLRKTTTIVAPVKQKKSKHMYMY